MVYGTRLLTLLIVRTAFVQQDWILNGAFAFQFGLALSDLVSKGTRCPRSGKLHTFCFKFLELSRVSTVPSTCEKVSFTPFTLNSFLAQALRTAGEALGCRPRGVATFRLFGVFGSALEGVVVREAVSSVAASPSRLHTFDV
jgi:hypothetical protein